MNSQNSFKEIKDFSKFTYGGLFSWRSDGEGYTSPTYRRHRKLDIILFLCIVKSNLKELEEEESPFEILEVRKVVESEIGKEIAL